MKYIPRRPGSANLRASWIHIQASARAHAAHGDLWAMRFTLPRFLTLSHIRSPRLPTQCGMMVAALWLTDRGDRVREGGKDGWMDGELVGGWRWGGRSSQVIVGEVRYTKRRTGNMSWAALPRRLMDGGRLTQVEQRFLNQLFFFFLSKVIIWWDELCFWESALTFVSKWDKCQNQTQHVGRNDPQMWTLTTGLIPRSDIGLSSSNVLTW